jgi:hypothetical protein
MNISELIKKLEDVRQKYGDVAVYIDASNYNDSECEYEEPIIEFLYKHNNNFLTEDQHVFYINGSKYPIEKCILLK